MKISLKKAVSATAVSLLTLTGSIVPLSVSAVTYDSRDVNRDGNVDILDTIKMNSYLLGKERTANLANLDVDGNGIVDYADSQCIMAKIANLNYYSQMSGVSKIFKAGTKTSAITNSTMSQTYARYTYATKAKDTYTLDAGSKVSTRDADDPDLPGVIGDDTRKQDYLGGMVYLTNGGTGFIVGDHVIATSAHCVYDRDDKHQNKNPKWVDDYQIRLYNNDGTPSNRILNPVETHMPYNFYSSSNDKYDYALIIVKEDLSDYYHFNLGMPYNIYTNTDFSNYDIYTTGFSGKTLDKNEEGEPIDNSNPPKMYTGKGKIVNASNVDKNLVCYDCDLTYGNSGGPVYVKETYVTGSTKKDINMVISICSGIYNKTEPHYNSGPTINPIMLRFYLNNTQVNQTIENFS